MATRQLRCAVCGKLLALVAIKDGTVSIKLPWLWVYDDAGN
jgi:phage FluMu protein Com